MSSWEAETDAFSHLVIANSAFKQSDAAPEHVHVYIDGDGTPWLNGRYVSSDPTPDRPYILNLMLLDDSPAIFIGRPCYFSLQRDIRCDDRYWTSHRYSKEVVSSMATVLQSAVRADTSVVLIGHSGGGAIAVLMAPLLLQERIDVAAVVTLAGNLDTSAWTDYHDYRPLHGSSNPAEQPALSHDIKQYHLSGSDDSNIPASLVGRYFDKQDAVEPEIVSSQSHACCWENIWREMLSRITHETVARDVERLEQRENALAQ